MSAEPTRLRYFVDTNVLGIIATRTHPLRIGYLALVAAEEFDDRTPSISTIVVNEVEAGLSTLDAGGSTAQQLAAAMRAVLDAFDHMDLDDEGQTLADKLQAQARAAGHPLRLRDHETDGHFRPLQQNPELLPAHSAICSFSHHGADGA